MFCANVLCILDRENAALSVAFLSPREMRALNSRYLRRNYATDVLSFSYDEVRMEGRPFLGEIVIAPQVAVLHASRYGVPPEKEMRKLLVHGILHLLGYNHETDRGEMNRLQARLLRKKLLTASPAIMNGKEVR